MAELHQWREPATTELGHIPQEAVRQPLAALVVLCLFQQLITEPLFEPVNGFQRRPLPEINRQPLVLLRTQVMPMAPHQGNQAAMFGAHPIELLPTRQEVMVHRTDDMEPVRDNAGLREVFAHQSAVTGGQIHANHLHALFARQTP